MASGLSQSQHHRPTRLSTGLISSGSALTSLHRASTAPASCTERITGPQPVDVIFITLYFLVKNILHF